jgi:hypothetical protein
MTAPSAAQSNIPGWTMRQHLLIVIVVVGHCAGTIGRHKTSQGSQRWIQRLSLVLVLAPALSSGEEDPSERVKRQRCSSHGWLRQRSSLAPASEARERPRRPQQSTELGQLSHQDRKRTVLLRPSTETAGLQGHEGIDISGIEKASTQDRFRQTHATGENKTSLKLPLIKA